MASIIYYPDKEKNGKSLLILSFTFNHARLRLSTGLHVPKENWEQENQIAVPVKKFGKVNKRLMEITSFFGDKYDELFPKGIKLSNEKVNRKKAELTNAYKIFTGRKTATESKKDSLISFVGSFQARLFIPANLTPHSGQPDPLF